MKTSELCLLFANMKYSVLIICVVMCGVRLFLTVNIMCDCFLLPHKVLKMWAWKHTYEPTKAVKASRTHLTGLYDSSRWWLVILRSILRNLLPMTKNSRIHSYIRYFRLQETRMKNATWHLAERHVRRDLDPPWAPAATREIFGVLLSRLSSLD